MTRGERVENCWTVKTVEKMIGDLRRWKLVGEALFFFSAVGLPLCHLSDGGVLEYCGRRWTREKDGRCWWRLAEAAASVGESRTCSDTLVRLIIETVCGRRCVGGVFPFCRRQVFFFLFSETPPPPFSDSFLFAQLFERSSKCWDSVSLFPVFLFSLHAVGLL